MSVSITSLTQLPDSGGVFDYANLAQINTNVTNQNTNNTNIQSAIVALQAAGFSAADGLTAHAGGTQAAALQLAAVINRVATVATAADSVKLPLAVAGAICIIVNDAANALQAFGAGTDTINDVATATGIPVAGNSVAIFFCTTSAAAGKWYSIPQWNATFVNAAVSGSLALATGPNFQATEGGANNAITFNLVDASGANIPLVAGLEFYVKLAHSLQAGANTAAINGGAAKAIKKHTNPANDIGVAYVSGSIFHGMYDGTVVQDLSQ